MLSIATKHIALLTALHCLMCLRAAREYFNDENELLDEPTLLHVVSSSINVTMYSRVKLTIFEKISDRHV